MLAGSCAELCDEGGFKMHFYARARFVAVIWFADWAQWGSIRDWHVLQLLREVVAGVIVVPGFLPQVL